MSAHPARIGALAAVPTLDDLAADPAKAAGLPVGVVQTMLFRCVTLQSALLGVLATAGANGTGASEPDTLLDVTAAAQRLGVSEDWLYRKSPKLPFTVRQGRLVRFSSDGLSRYIRSRQGRAPA